MSAREMKMWKMYEKVKGYIGKERDDVQAAIIAHIIYAVNGGKDTTIDGFVFKGGETPDEREKRNPLAAMYFHKE